MKRGNCEYAHRKLTEKNSRYLNALILENKSGQYISKDITSIWENITFNKNNQLKGYKLA